MHPRDKARYLKDVASWERSDLNPPGLVPGTPNKLALQDLTTRQYALYEFMESMVDAYGKFDQTLGPDNAQYLTEADNPLGQKGIMCSACAFYAGGGCDLVAGAIQPGGVCQYALVTPSKAADELQVRKLAAGTGTATYS